MSARMKAHHIKRARVIIEIPRHPTRIHYVPVNDVSEIEAYLQQHVTTGEVKELIDWKILAKDRIEKHKKAGIVLRGARYRENCSQKELAKRSKVTQEDISKIENGKRTVGEKVAKRLARVLHIDYKMLLDTDNSNT